MGRYKNTTQGVDHWTTLSGITYYFSLLLCKKIYALHEIPSYQNLLSKVWINFSSWINFYLHYRFFINLKMTTEWAFAFLNTAIIIFCLRYSLNIPHSNENPSFFSCVRRSIHLFKIQISVTFHYIVMIIVRKINLTFLFVWFHGRGNYILHSLFIVSRPSS